MNREGKEGNTLEDKNRNNSNTHVLANIGKPKITPYR